VSADRLAIRLRRLEQQIRSFKELHTTEVSDLARKLEMMTKLHADELQLILDELADIAAEATPPASTEPRAEATDPAARSPKRAKWLAEQERKTRPLSRRELLRGRGEGPKA